MAASGRRWGWHQLDHPWAKRLVAEAGITPGAIVVDIGAGHGALTGALVDVGARVIAVEAHPQRARHLRQRFGGSVVVVQTDARSLRLPRRPYHVVANPPFGLTAALMRLLLQPGSHLLTARLVLQEQAARRWADPSAPGFCRWGRTYGISLGARLPRSAFRPQPRVDARLVVIERRPQRPTRGFLAGVEGPAAARLTRRRGARRRR